MTSGAIKEKIESYGYVTSSGISHDGSTANGVLTYKDADEATVESALTFDGSTLALTGASTISSTLQMGSTAGQSGAKISAIKSGNSYEFGHVNSAGYRSNLGANLNNGYPFLAFYAESSENSSNQYTTRGIKGVVLTADTSNNFTINQVTTASAANQNLTERLRIDSSGNVGINKVSPSYKLDVNRADAGIIAQFQYGSDTDGRIQIYADANAGSIGNDSGLAGETIYFQDDVGLRFYTGGAEAWRMTTSRTLQGNNAAITGVAGIYGNSGTLNLYNSTTYFKDTSSNVMATLNSSGLMLKNNTFFMAEDADGDDIGLLGIHSNNNCYVGPKDNAYAGGYMLYGAASAMNGHVWYEGNAERMRIADNGYLGIATNSPLATLDLGSAGGEKFYVYCNGASVRNGLGIDMSGTSRELSYFHSSSNASDGQHSWGYRLESNGSYVERMKLTGAGILTVSGTGGFTIGNVAGAARIQEASNEFAFLTTGNAYANIYTNDVIANGKIIHYGDTNTYMQFSAADTWKVYAGGQNPLTAIANRVYINATGANGLLINNDEGTAANSARIFFEGTSTSAIFQEGSDLSFRSGATTGSSSGTERFKVHSSGATAVGDFDTTGSYKMDGTTIMNSSKALTNLYNPFKDGISDLNESTLVTDYAAVTTPTSTGWYTIASASSANARGGGIISISLTGGYFGPRNFTCDFQVDWSGNLMRCNIVNQQYDIEKVRLIETGSTTELQAYFNISTDQGNNSQSMHVSFTHDKYNPNYSIEDPLTQEGSPAVTGEEITANGNTFYGSEPDDFKVYNSHVVFNEASMDVDFRVESNNSAQMLFVDGGNDRVGINRNDPSYRLDVAGDARFTADIKSEGRVMAQNGTAAAPAYSFTSQGDAGMTRVGNGVGFSADDYSRVEIDAEKMFFRYNSTSNSTTGACRLQWPNDQRIFDNGGGGLKLGAASYAVNIYSGTSSDMITFHNGGISGAETARITPTGLELANTKKLVLDGAGGNTYINQNSGSSSRLDFTVNGTGVMDLWNDHLTLNGYILSGSNSDTNGVVALAIRLAGDDLYNVWGSQYSSGKMMMGAKVKPKTGSEGFVSSADNAGFSREAVTMGSGLWQYYTAASATVAVGTSVTMTERVRFDASGNGHFDADVVAYSSTVSDERLKDNVKTIPNALDKVKALRGVEFDWNATSRKGKHDIGVIAQEVEEVLPEIVKEHTLCTGEFTDNEKEFKTVDYDKMIGVLIEAIKEQQVQIDELKTKLGE